MEASFMLKIIFVDWTVGPPRLYDALEAKQMFMLVFGLNFGWPVHLAMSFAFRIHVSIVQECGFSAMLTYLSRSLQSPLPLQWCDISDLNLGTFWRSRRC